MRRNIQIKGLVSTTNQVRLDIKERMKERFKDASFLDKFIDILMRTGWDVLDIDSAVKQYENKERPSVQALMTNNHPSLDYVFQNQYTYTHNRDTAQDPNYAVRHRGQTELLFRRLTPGDLILLMASQQLEHIEDLDQSKYWEEILASMFKLVGLPYFVSDPKALMAGAYVNLLKVLPDLTPEELNTTFFQESSSFYLHVNMRLVRTRVDSRYEDKVEILAYNSLDTIYKAIVILHLYCLDEKARRNYNGINGNIILTLSNLITKTSSYTDLKDV